MDPAEKLPFTAEGNRKAQHVQLASREILKRSGREAFASLLSDIFYGQSEQYRLSQVDNVPVKSVLPQILAVP